MGAGQVGHAYYYMVLIAQVPEVDREVIRGSPHVLNWWGTKAEFLRTVETSLDDSLGNLHEWLARQCLASRQVPTSD